MLHNYNFTAKERFLRYVQIDTQSNPECSTFPSTDKQKDLSTILVSELLQMGIKDAFTNEYGYVYATIPSNTTKQVPTICFCSHIDTAPDCSGTNVKPILHEAYNGNDIFLPDDENQVISTKQYPYLLQHLGNSIITASGLTLLGADDKSGVAEIMDFANYLQTHPFIKHGTIKILFTPDEEVGAGTAKLDMDLLNANIGYTLDGGEVGTLEDETFNADGISLTINGVIAHPGYGKNTLVNAIKIACEIVAALPKTEWSPETTDGREGFVHPTHISGSAEQATIDFLIRDFEVEALKKYKEKLLQIANTILQKYPKASMDVMVNEQYRNMKLMLDNNPAVINNAIEAYKRAGITNIVKEPIRGGTDGSKLSFMGLPCANLFTGMQAIHSKHEWIGVQDMEKAVAVLVQLVQVWEERS